MCVCSHHPARLCVSPTEQEIRFAELFQDALFEADIFAGEEDAYAAMQVHFRKLAITTV